MKLSFYLKGLGETHDHSYRKKKFGYTNIVGKIHRQQ